MKTKYILTLLIATASVAHANIIDLGEIDLTGTFTLNHLYDFNNQGAAPFGWFGTITVQNVTGIFTPYVSNGNNLDMSSNALNSVAPFPNWTIGGFSLLTTYVAITGADSGRNCFGFFDLSGNGFNPPTGTFSYWNFIAPPYDISHFDHDITGPITLNMFVRYDDGHVPDTGGTLLLLGFGLAALVGARMALPEIVGKHLSLPRSLRESLRNRRRLGASVKPPD